MRIDIRQGNYKYLDDCIEALMQSELGKHYFYQYDKAKRTIEAAPTYGLDEIIFELLRQIKC